MKNSEKKNTEKRRKVGNCKLMDGWIADTGLDFMYPNEESADIPSNFWLLLIISLSNHFEYGNTILNVIPISQIGIISKCQKKERKKEYIYKFRL